MVASAICWAATTTLVAFVRQSPPAGLPVTDGDPKTPRMSSRIWKASPTALPVGAQGVDQRFAAGHRRADLQWTAHGEVAGLAPGDVENHPDPVCSRVVGDVGDWPTASSMRMSS